MYTFPDIAHWKYESLPTFIEIIYFLRATSNSQTIENKHIIIITYSPLNSILTDLTSAPSWCLRIGWDMAWHTRNCPTSKPFSDLAARMAVTLAVIIGCQPRSCGSRQICRDQSGALNSMTKRLIAASILSILLDI